MVIKFNYYLFYSLCSLERPPEVPTPHVGNHLVSTQVKTPEEQQHCEVRSSVSYSSTVGEKHFAPPHVVESPQRKALPSGSEQEAQHNVNISKHRSIGSINYISS